MIFRILLGLYLVWHFIQIIPYAEELFGTDMPFDPTLSPIYGIFPNALNHVSATGFIIFLTIISAIMTLEMFPRTCAFILWYGWAALFNRNLLIHNPGIPYVGWILLAMTFIEKDAARITFDTNNGFLKYIQQDKFPKRILWAAWILMAAGYTASGLHKLVTSPSWTDGTALQHILESCLARDNILRDGLVQFPLFLKFSTWLSLFLEISFLTFGVFYYVRLPYWIAYICFHVGILMLINFTDLTMGVLMIHFFTFDWRWTSLFNKYIAEKIKTKMEMKYGTIGH